jgi:hypothetical protein
LSGNGNGGTPRDRWAARTREVKDQLEGVPDSALDTWASFVDNPEVVTTTVHEVTGSPAHTFAEWAHEHADEFR